MDQSAIKYTSGKQLRRVDGAQFEVGKQVLETAYFVVVPDEQTQRKAFGQLMPQLYALRNKGCSWTQLAKLLLECDINLQPSSVRAYYGEMLEARLDVCQARMNESLLSLAQARKETQSQITPLIANHAEKIRKLAQQRVDGLSAVQKKEPPSAAAVTKKPTATPSSISQASQSDAPIVRQPAQPMAAPVGTAIILDGSKAVSPVPAPKTGGVTGGALTCRPLQKGVPATKRRPGVQEDVYLPGELEHPAITGLMLSLEARLYGAALEYTNESGEPFIESQPEKRFRILWTSPVPMTKSTTSGDFVQTDESLFPPIVRAVETK